MRAGAQLSDSDSDETIVEGSVTESDLDEEELHVKRLSSINKDVTQITEVIFAAETEEINRGLEPLSPEIQCVSKFSDYLQKVSQEIGNSEQSQSLLQGERDCPVFTTTVSQTGLQLSTSEERWQNDSGAVGTEEPGFLTEPERERFNDEDESPEESLLSGAIAKETFMVPKELTLQNIFPSVLKDCQSASMMIIELDAKVKDHSVNTDTAVSSAPPEKISKEAFTAQRIMADEFEIQDLLKPLSESESPKMINFLHDILECQDDVLSVDTLGDEKNNALPEELLTALNSLSESLVQPVYQLAETERELRVMEEHLRSELSISQRDDECTQIADTFESWFYIEQLKERKTLTESKLWNIKDEQLAGDQKKNDIVIADYRNVTSSDREANEGNSSSNKTILGVETTKTTPYPLRRSARLKENFTKNRMQESASKDSEDQCSELGDGMCKGSTLDINNQDKQIRRSQRIAKRIGWTAIHEASKKGFTEVILELLKAGADVNSKGPDGILPIHDAVSGNYFKAVSILLQHGANPNEKDSDGNTALDKACSDKMKELLKSYGAADTGVAEKVTEVTDIPPSRSRRSPQSYDCCNMPDEPLILHRDKAREKHDMHKSVITVLQDIEEKQKKLLLFELRTPKDAEMYIQRLSQIQDTLNGMLAKQKAERDMLAKKYRASVESFKQGALREQLVQLASRQKSLLMVAKKQKELGQKIQNYRNAKKTYSGCSKKQIPNSVPSTENDDREYVTPDKRVHPDVVTVSMGPDARLLNGNRLEAHLSLESRFSAQEHSQYQNSSLDEAGANERAIRSMVVSAQALASENMVREWTFDKMSKSKSADAMEMVTLLSEPVCLTQRECSEQKKIDYTGVAVQGSKSPNPIAVTSRLNISEAQNIVVNNNIHQPTTDCQQVLPGKLQNYTSRNEVSQQQPRVVSESTESSSVGLQQNNRTSPNANLEPTSFAPNIFYSVNINQNPSSQFSHHQEKGQQLSNRKCRRKKCQLVDLLELGKIKPGEDVLEFTLQDFSHKATLLRDGRIQTSGNRIHGNPVQWVKALLGNDISVSWKYAWNKVAYLGTELSKILVEEASVPNKPEVTSQLKEPSEPSIQFDLVEKSTNFLHFTKHSKAHCRGKKIRQIPKE
ncbi:putative ankyrin repeat domain-containing protein 31 isoform A [Alligator mississippiensis]|uniref:Ankyrin repeat domain-containing protein 31 isoform A n=1 Tax=Alligator mississippiensis TaxID=8496 RepID=A0A151PHI1_ALLMI|nr:putative ankyrin repeat domain-containing protein 31 isoform A [Alligator mississippiensis]